YNPNIYPADEYQRRFEESRDYCKKHGIHFIELLPDQDRWFVLTKGHEQDPERGERCTMCYRMRMEKTAQYAKEHGYNVFGTDLSISPHKDAVRLNSIGRVLEQEYGITYLMADFKKQDGFKKAMELSRNECFYRQNYCGCVYSMQALNSKTEIRNNIKI
ncbi:MAG: epoxyqueuosine reductase QueH, partial [Patescibacteria group bacterium]